MRIKVNLSAVGSVHGLRPGNLDKPWVFNRLFVIADFYDIISMIL
jgi:hypothetical protein